MVAATPLQGLSIYSIQTLHGHVDPYSCLSAILVGFLLVTRNLREFTPSQHRSLPSELTQRQYLPSPLNLRLDPGLHSPIHPSGRNYDEQRGGSEIGQRRPEMVRFADNKDHQTDITQHPRGPTDVPPTDQER